MGAHFRTGVIYNNVNLSFRKLIIHYRDGISDTDRHARSLHADCTTFTRETTEQRWECHPDVESVGRKGGREGGREGGNI